MMGILVDAAHQQWDASGRSINEADALRSEKQLKVLASVVLGLIAEGWLFEGIMQAYLARDV